MVLTLRETWVTDCKGAREPRNSENVLCIDLNGGYMGVDEYKKLNWAVYLRLVYFVYLLNGIRLCKSKKNQVMEFRFVVGGDRKALVTSTGKQLEESGISKIIPSVVM